MTPTIELYNSMQIAFDHFNQTLFNNELPHVIITMQRKQNICGYFAANKWVSKTDGTAHEIAINPEIIGQTALLEYFQTLVHEMAHLWQKEFGNAGRRGYHNKEWAKKMEDIGLMPSDTGRPGGKKTGEKIADYPIKDGQFMQSVETLINTENSTIKWFDKRPKKPAYSYTTEIDLSEELGIDEQTAAVLSATVTDLIDLPSQPTSTPTFKKKTCYQCPSCKIKVWGRPELNINCNDCNVKLEASE